MRHVQAMSDVSLFDCPVYECCVCTRHWHCLYLLSMKYETLRYAFSVTWKDREPTAWFLKRFHEEMAPIVHDIICASIVQCKYPSGYKYALISPVPKVNNPTDLNNEFRQMSVLPQIAKVLENHCFANR